MVDQWGKGGVGWGRPVEYRGRCSRHVGGGCVWEVAQTQHMHAYHVPLKASCKQLVYIVGQRIQVDLATY